MKLALVITVKNERKLLRENLIYHHFLGIEHTYIYLDGTDDGTEETIKDLKFVSISNSVDPEPYQGQPEIREFIEHHAEHHVARQCLNVYHTQKLAMKAGYDWLISLDADELLCVDPLYSYPNQLIDFFNGIDPGIEMVRFTTLEIVQRKMTYKNVFSEETLFKESGAKLQHLLYDPFKHRIFRIRKFYGQTMGKAAIRTNVVCKPRTTHKFVGLDERYLVRVWQGYLLHYYGYDFDDFIKKYRNFQHRPDKHLSGNDVEYIKRLWRDMVNRSDMSIDDIRAYYQRWFLFKPLEVARLSRSRILGLIKTEPQIIEVTSVQNAFKELNSQKESE